MNRFARLRVGTLDLGNGLADPLPDRDPGGVSLCQHHSFVLCGASGSAVAVTVEQHLGTAKDFQVVNQRGDSNALESPYWTPACLEQFRLLTGCRRQA